MTEILRIDGLHKSFGPLEVLKGIDLSIQQGETVVVLGASGSGESTLLRGINKLEYPTAGRIHLSGLLIGDAAGPNSLVTYREASLYQVRTRIGMVFQQFNLFP